ncbi:hypothetical protein [Agrococcus beijingensis]|uniref:hypothetical protein n=1 Tax=Agrococcus beijingensis TaxID=3068634 RepID=UPI0027415A66|nr:hypothetical protein [Agrococcus sp. REN33]
MDDITPDRLLELGDLPLADEAALLERARTLIQQGYVRRLWLLAIDERGLLVPQLTQLDDPPITPDAPAVGALRRIIGFFADAGTSLAVVLERPGSPWPSPDDWAWHDVIHRAAADRPEALRGVLLAHGCGVDLLEPDADDDADGQTGARRPRPDAA